MPAARLTIASGAADALARAGAEGRLPPALIGFDGFVDRMVRMVATRRSMESGDFEPIATITQFADRCRHAANRSTNIEQVLIEERFGGNGPLMASALARLGVPVTFIGAIGLEGSPGAIHPIFEPFAKLCRLAVPVCPPSWTFCMEFEDGKIMLNDTAAVQGVTWEAIVGAVGIDALRATAEPARLLGVVNWSLLGGVPGIWRGLLRDVLPGLAAAPRTLMIDLSDPAKRTDVDIGAALADLRALAEAGLDVVLGLNLAEAARIASLGEPGPALDGRPGPGAIRDAAARIRDFAGLSTVIVHPRHGAAAAEAGSAPAWFDGPFTRTPRLSTGAGDHFNAGFSLGRALGLPVDQCLASGCALSGYYVRHARGPALADLCDFLRHLPEPEPPAPAPGPGA